ncbi:MAG: HAMP domain-containing sensor histidine kinase, partial [Solirubrobacteraceae bacterium]
LPEAATLDEIGRLTGVLNRMLASLEQARESERRLLADASHELRTPVTALLGNVEYAARHGADPEVLSELRHDAHRLARLVDSLLALERAREGTPELERLSLDHLVRRAVDDHDPGRVHIASLDAATVDGDEGALRRALGNLIENGLVHGPSRGHVTVSLDVVGDRAMVSVTDQGVGPDPALHGQLFERFWRGPGASERPGSGLGLSIVAAIAAHHDGQVRVDGPTFILDLPVAHSQGE